MKETDRERDGDIGEAVGERAENNRREEGGRLSCSSHSFSISTRFSPLPHSNEYQFCHRCSNTGALNGIPGSVNAGVGKTSQALLLNPLFICIRHFVEFLLTRCSSLTLKPIQGGSWVTFMGLCHVSKWGNTDLFHQRRRCAGSIWRPSPVRELHVKDDAILSSSCVNPWLLMGWWSWFKHKDLRTHTHTHTPAEVTVWPCPDSGYCLCGLRGWVGGWKWSGGGANRDRSQKHVRAADERGKKVKCVERRMGESMKKKRKRWIDKWIDKWRGKEKQFVEELHSPQRSLSSSTSGQERKQRL